MYVLFDLFNPSENEIFVDPDEAKNGIVHQVERPEAFAVPFGRHRRGIPSLERK